MAIQSRDDLDERSLGTAGVEIGDAKGDARWLGLAGH
jgi:hypothetical protein